MKAFDYQLHVNTFPLQDRESFFKFTCDLLTPAFDALHRGNTRMHISNTSSGATDAVSEIEGFSRLIWALGSMNDIEMPDDAPWWKLIREGIKNGVDPQSQDYFGEMSDYDQRLVETAAMGMAFVYRRNAIFDMLDESVQAKFLDWIRVIEERKAHDCNWKFFRIMVQIGLKELGFAYNKEAMKEHLDELDSYYVKDGWYRDGNPDRAHADYYVPFAMHFYGLFYAMYMKEEDPKRCKKYEERAIAFAKDFLYWFDADGAALPYGRSLTYRFAQIAFWSILVVSGIDLPFELGVVKGLIQRHFEWWMKQPIFDRNGILTLGYAYPNAFMTEEYNAPGSVYWALKSMILLRLEADHPFWSVKALPMPVMASRSVQQIPRIAICSDQKRKQIIAYTSGHFHTNGHTHVEYKYEKFAYSSRFGFCVPRGAVNLASGGFDNMLAISEDGIYYRHKRFVKNLDIQADKLIITWEPYLDVSIETELIYGYPSHKRIHRIKNERPIFVAEGGFAIGVEGVLTSEQGQCRPFAELVQQEGDFIGAAMMTDQDNVGIVNRFGYEKAMLIKAAAGTNLMNPLVYIPTLTARLEIGEHHLESIIWGDVFEHVQQPETEYLFKIIESIKYDLY